MSATSFNQLFGNSLLQRPAHALPSIGPRGNRLHALLDRDELRGKVQRGHANQSGGTPKLSQGLDKRLGAARRFGFRKASETSSGGFDSRQRAVVKVHYFGHSGGGAAALKAHARYVARDAANRAANPEHAPHQEQRMREDQGRAHVDYLERSDGRSVFYDARDAGVDGAARAAAWARDDRRHFRVILAPEKGAELKDMKPYVRDVMARAEAALGRRLEWLAVDHWDTDNPHTHIILRGRAAGRALVIPRDFIKHGFRNAARDAATERLGPRTRDDERLALHREARAHRPTRLDAMIAQQMRSNGEIRLAMLEAANNDPSLTDALKARTKELARLGLAIEVRRNVVSFRDGWRSQLAAMEMHLDVRKRLLQQRAVQQRSNPGVALSDKMRGPQR
ncbi:MAG: relaxase/mobilization nuclease domain-containing protein [Proteobacteria bacterium]|nr:relaxase/mobilization nuclease domain-containing protein [Pseudomonadota bacterium]